MLDQKGDVGQILRVIAAHHLRENSSGTNDTADSYMAKYAAADGALLWETRFGPASESDSVHPQVVGIGARTATSAVGVQEGRWGAADLAVLAPRSVGRHASPTTWDTLNLTSHLASYLTRRPASPSAPMEWRSSTIREGGPNRPRLE
jgi:hypothetical protein